MARAATGYRIILHETFAENLQNELDRSHMDISLSPFFSLSFSPRYCVKIFILQLVENYGRNTIEASNFYFIRYWDFLSSPANSYSNRMDTLRLAAEIFLAGRDYVPPETTLPLRAFLFDETPRKYIAFKSKFNFCEKNEFIKCLICLLQNL